VYTASLRDILAQPQARADRSPGITDITGGSDPCPAHGPSGKLLYSSSS